MGAGRTESIEETGDERPGEDRAEDSGPRRRPPAWAPADPADAAQVPRWRLHDRTHLELAVHYPAEGDLVSAHEWEAYFFLPTSLRVDATTYREADVYADLRSYVRFTVPEVPFDALAAAPLSRLQAALRADGEDVTRELRLFACAVRAAAVQRRRALFDALADPSRRESAFAEVSEMLDAAARVTGGLRRALRAYGGADGTRRAAARWVDEDVSRLLELAFGALSARLRKAKAPASLRERVVAAAVREARYREEVGLGVAGRAGASKREVEHLEFRRHVLKRFTSSVLWLTPEVRAGARVVLQVLYALAAGVAMAFAVTAALWNGAPQFANHDALWAWSAVAVIAYMGKDRIKALLQAGFSRLVSKHFPDRRWWVRTPGGRGVLAKVDEVSGFLQFGDLPPAVLDKRRAGRHPIEELSRPEEVLWHRKVVRLDPRQVRGVDAAFGGLTEIFRVDLRRWLAHTDDPKRRIFYAATDSAEVCAATAPRVYNISIVHRRVEKGGAAPWRRVRVVVSRKGILRVEDVDALDERGAPLSGSIEASRRAPG